MCLGGGRGNESDLGGGGAAGCAAVFFGGGGVGSLRVSGFKHVLHRNITNFYKLFWRIIFW